LNLDRVSIATEEGSLRVAKVHRDRLVRDLRRRRRSA
jgi:hypothetical protein